MVNSFRGAIPARVVSIASISAGVHSLLTNRCELLIAQATLNIKELLGDLLICWVTRSTDTGVPSWLLCAEEVAIDLMLHRRDCVLDLGVLRVSVVLPPSEARLVTSVILLAVMDRADFDLSFQVILLRQGSRGQHGHWVL